MLIDAQQRQATSSIKGAWQAASNNITQVCSINLNSKKAKQRTAALSRSHCGSTTCHLPYPDCHDPCSYGCRLQIAALMNAHSLQARICTSLDPDLWLATEMAPFSIWHHHAARNCVAPRLSLTCCCSCSRRSPSCIMGSRSAAVLLAAIMARFSLH